VIEEYYIVIVYNVIEFCICEAEGFKSIFINILILLIFSGPCFRLPNLPNNLHYCLYNQKFNLAESDNFCAVVYLQYVCTRITNITSVTESALNQ